jgi:ribosomal 30S subunit maturation factor RimM
VRPDPSVDTMILTMNDGSRAEVPIVDAWVGEVDTTDRTVKLLNDDGIILG